MDYLARLPVEVWTLIVRAALVLDSGANWPPSDSLAFCLLDRTYERVGDLPKHKPTTGSNIRLVCSSFKSLLDQLPAQGAPRIQIGSRKLSQRFYPSPRHEGLTTLTVLLCGTSKHLLSINRQLNNLWTSADSLPNLRALTIDGASGTWAEHPFWEKLGSSFPRIESLAIRPLVHLILMYSGPEAVTLCRLRHLYLPRVSIRDLPWLPQLQMLRVHHFADWRPILERAPSLATLSISSNRIPLLLSPVPTRLRYFECNVADVDVLKSIDTSAAEDKLDLLVLTISGSSLEDDGHVSHVSPQAYLTAFIFEVYKKHYATEIHLNFTRISDEQQCQVKAECVRKGVQFDRRTSTRHIGSSPAAPALSLIRPMAARSQAKSMEQTKWISSQPVLKLLRGAGIRDRPRLLRRIKGKGPLPSKP